SRRMGKRVLVTGAGSGFGRDASLALAESGCDVIATTETEAQADALAAAAPQLRVEKLDITTDDVHKAAGWDVDVLLNNAGVGFSGPLAEIPLATVQRVFAVNVFGTLALTQQVLTRMIPRGSGRVLIMSSVGGLVTVPTFGAYTMSKHALEAMGKTLRAELDGTGIDVALINPGPYATGFNDRMAESMWSWFGDAALQNERSAEFRAAGEGITSGQLDPADVATLIVELVHADSVEPNNVLPPDILAAFG
ncbi:MAG: SDR family NAD(P)-dependent oxidoreductase, partial [Pseudomonadota bacterium]